MRVSIIASALAALAGSTSAANPLLKERAACNADNCARLVTGTRAGLPSTRLQDCRSFLFAVVTPAPIYVATTITPSTTVYSTVATVTATSYVTGVTQTPTTAVIIRTSSSSSASSGTANTVTYYQQRRDASPDDPALTSNPTQTATPSISINTPDPTPITTTPPPSRAPTPIGAITRTATSIPSYASSVCAPLSRYSSACQCAGVTGSTQTVVGPTTTLTATGSVTATLTSSVTRTTTTTYTVAATAPLATETVYGLPCDSVYNPRGEKGVKYQVLCGRFPKRVRGNVGQAKGVSEGECVGRCAAVEGCVLATYGFKEGSCVLWSDVVDGGLVSDLGADVIVKRVGSAAS